MNNQNFVRRLLKVLDKKISDTNDILYNAIVKNLDNGFSIEKSINSAFKKLNIESKITSYTIDSIVKSASYGIGKDNKFKINKTDVLTNKILSQCYNKNKLKLSNMIHKNILLAKNKISNVIKVSRADGEAINVMAQKIYDSYLKNIKTIDMQKRLKDLARMRISGKELDKTLQDEIKLLSRRVNRLRTEPLKASYNQLLKSIKNGAKQQISKNLKLALDEKLKYHSLMIARTESARAYYAAFESRAAGSSNIGGIKVTLSSSHRIYDICDLYASIDVGYGKGVYPLSKMPKYPLHPHCFCVFTNVYINKISKETIITPTKINRAIKFYLDTISKEQAVRLLGLDGYETYIEKGIWKSNLINYSRFHAAKSVLKESDF